MAVFFVSLIQLSILALTLYLLTRRGEKREIIVFCALWLIASVFSLLIAAGVNLPAGVDIMKFLLAGVSNRLDLGGPL